MSMRGGVVIGGVREFSYRTGAIRAGRFVVVSRATQPATDSMSPAVS